MENNAKAKVSSVGIAKVGENVSIINLIKIQQQSKGINPKLRVSNEKTIPK